MTYDDIIILIPSHSLEDFPTDIGEDDAAGLLNAFAVAWHPALLAEAGVLPSWHRADDQPETLDNRLFIVPSASEEWVQGGWTDYAHDQGATVISGISDRKELIQAVLAPLLENDSEEESENTSPDQSQQNQTNATDASPSENENENVASSEDSQDAPVDVAETAESAESPAPSAPRRRPPKTDPREIDPEIVADFLALGTCYLQIELLTRHMHHFSNFDEVHLQREAVSAAEAAMADDPEAARSHLSSCFEILTEARERFYPVDCYLIDLCLLIPRLADGHLKSTLATRKPINLLVSPESLQTISDESTELFGTVREGWEAGCVDLIGGEWEERPTSLMPLQSLLWDLNKGHAHYRTLFGRVPTTWGRKRFGFTTQMPQILNKFGYRSALHLALDDGIYPDAEQSKIRWEGSDGTVIDAITRIPLAADSATSFLRFAMRMAESMEEDQVAAVIFARWPEVQTPWFEDFRRIHGYSSTLGRFVTLEEFFDQTDDPGRLSTFEATEYLSPFLIQSVARQEKNPISRYAEHLKRRQAFDAACWYDSVAAVLKEEPIGEEQNDVEAIMEQAGPEAEPETIEKAESRLQKFVTETSQKLADTILPGEGDQAGFLLLNSLSFPRTVSVSIPELQSPPAPDEFIKTCQFDDTRKFVTVKLPPSGFVWIPSSTDKVKYISGRRTPPLAEENLLQNEFFEVHINEQTGGISRIKEYGRHPNRLSQQLAFRFPRERTFLVQTEDSQREEQSYYSEMQCESLEVTCNGPALGEIVTTGRLVDQQNNATLATFRQTYRIWRSRPVVEVEIELDNVTIPEGDPWTNYIASRFAWNDSTASLTRSIQQGAYGVKGERFESLHYLEIASDNQRTTILNPSSPFYRKTGTRILDNPLIVAGETAHRFRFSVAVDADYPMQAALDAMVPPAVVPTTSAPASNGTSGWFFHLNAKNVQILRVMGAAPEPPQNLEPWELHDYEQLPPGDGFAVRLLETEGRHRQVKLRCFKTPTRARQRDFHGKTLTDLTIVDDCVIIDLTAYEIADLEIRFHDNA